MASVGITFGIVAGRLIFGGAGRYLVNPSVLGFAFLMFSYSALVFDPGAWIPVPNYDEPTTVELFIDEGGIIALGLNAGAFMSEIIRAGIESVSKGQNEAAQSVGMTYLQRMRYVVLPQAFARVAPPLLGQTAVLIKDSSLVSFIGVFELFGAGLVILNERLMPNEGFITVAICYLAIYAIMLQVTVFAQGRLGGTASA
jgi:ABC-type amino acid transport system permease subunit